MAESVGYGNIHEGYGDTKKDPSYYMLEQAGSSRITVTFPSHISARKSRSNLQVDYVDGRANNVLRQNLQSGPTSRIHKETSTAESKLCHAAFPSFVPDLTPACNRPV